LKYTGQGNVDDESNWTSYTPIVDLHFRWLGDPAPAPFPYPGWPSTAAANKVSRHPTRR
jgi:hypothetical protein